MDPAIEKATKDMQEAVVSMRAATGEAEAQLKEVGDDVKKVAGDVERLEGVSGDVKERIAKAEAGVVAAEDHWNEVKAAQKAADEARDALEVKVDNMKRHRTSGGGSADEVLAKEAAYASAYSKALRGGLGSERERPLKKWKLDEAETKAMADVEEKALAANSGPDGGYFMPEAQRGDLIRKLIEMDPMEELADSVTLSQGDTWEAPREGSQNFECEWVGETGARAETASGKVAMETIVAHELYAKPLITQKMLDDPGFDVAAWMNDRLARRFSVKRGQAFISGSGSGQPEGITVSTTAIGAGDFGYVPLGNASTITDDGLWDLTLDLPEFYSSRATWLWRRSTTAVIRKLKDGNQNYIWAPAFQEIPPTVAGLPYRESISMPEVAANAFSVALGDWKSAVLIVRRQAVNTLRDPYSSKPYVEFYTTMRVGGAPVLNEAYRLGKIATS